MSFTSKIGSLASRAYGWSAAVARAVDQYFEYVTLLLPGNGTNGANNNTFLDSSTNNFNITRNGNTTQGTFSPFSQTGWGNYFDGSGDALYTPNTGQFAPTGDFTIGFWLYPITLGTQVYLGNYTSNLSTDWSIETTASGVVDVYTNGATKRIGASAGTLTTGAWFYIALVRSSNTITLYVNGSSKGTYAQSGTFGSATKSIYIGANSSLSAPSYSYISNVILIDGTATTTVPTAPSTAVSGTSLLTCQSNRFKDNSTNNFTLTVNGNTSVVAFSPFNPTSSWSAATYGGSGYFDGSGDYLSMTSGVSLGSGDFTISCWVYLTAAPGIETAVGSSYNYYTSGNNGNFVFRVGTQNLWASFDGQSNSASISGTFSWQLNTWIYMAWVRSGSTVTVYRNGTSLGSTTDTKTLSNSANGYVIGVDRINGTVFNYLTGYMSGLRVLVGTADTAVPTSPFSSSGTSLLLAFTNAGITDATAKNDLETVGNAQISNAVTPKWGSTSIKFDGTGNYLYKPYDQLLNQLNGNFTIECWIYPTVTNTQMYFAGSANSSGSDNWLFGVTSSNKLYFNWVNTTPTGFAATSTASISQNVWTYVAAVKSGGTITLYINGSADGTSSPTGTYRNASFPFAVGRPGDYNGIYFTGYIQDFRMTTYARTITASPTAAFPTL